MSAEVESMFYVRETPWHGLGVRVEDALTSEEALIQSGLKWRVLPKAIVIDGHVAHGYIANVRETDGNILGIVSDRYRIVQNEDAFSFVDQIIGTGKVRYETAGSLFEGKKVWMLARMDEVKLLDDTTVPYLVFVNDHTGKGSVKVALTPIRVVCNNTLNLALKEADRSWATKHMGDMEAKKFEAMRTLNLATEYMTNLQEEADELAKVVVSDKMFTEIVEELFPMPANGKSDRKIINIQDYRAEVKFRYEMAPDLQKYRGSGWAVINAVSDFVSHSAPKRKSATFAENRFANIIEGDKLIDRAYSLLKAA